MKRATLPLIFLALSCSITYAQIKRAPEAGFEFSKYILKEGMSRSYHGHKASQQGIAIYGDYIFCLEHGGHALVYPDTPGRQFPIGSFDLESSGPDQHANCINFGNETAPGASFPLLYVTNGKKGGSQEFICYVESITKTGSRKHPRFENKQVQSIFADTTGYSKKGYVPFFGCPSWEIDAERGFIWIFSARKRTVPAVTKEFWSNQYIATKFRIPKLSEGKEITLGVEDVLDQVLFEFDTYFTQGGCASDGKIYFSFGTSDDYNKDGLTPQRIRVYDTDERRISAEYELHSMMSEEPEDLTIKDGYMYLNTNSSEIYRISLPKKEDNDTLEYNPELAAGIYYVKDFSGIEPDKAPEGFKPFYISSYARHGARYVDEAATWPVVYASLRKAALEGNLTPMGQALWDRVQALNPTMEHRTGELTRLGYRQWQDAARRVNRLYPEVMAGKNPIIRAEASNVMRVAMSMSSFCAEMKALHPDVRLDMYVSEADLDHINPYMKTAPGNTDLDQKIRSKEGAWYPVYRKFITDRIAPQAMMERLFIHPEKTGTGPFEFCQHLYYFAADQRCLERAVPCWDFFTDEEIRCWYEADNCRLYMQKGRCETNLGRGWGLAEGILAHIIGRAQSEMEEGGIRYCFGHDVCMMALLAYMKADDWGIEVAPEEVGKYWKGWMIPMGSSLDFIFYRNEEGKVLVHPVLNGKALSIPIEKAAEGFYEWETFKALVPKN